MTRALTAFLLVIAAILMLVHCRAETHPLLVEAACAVPKLPNPCDTVDCNRRDTKEIV